MKVRVAFSEAIDESPENVAEHGVRVEGGRVTSVRRVGNQPAGGAAARSAGRSGGGQEDEPEDGERVWELTSARGARKLIPPNTSPSVGLDLVCAPVTSGFPPHRTSTLVEKRRNPH